MTTTTTSSPAQDRTDWWAGLPEDLLACVFQHLSIHSRICFRAVCRSWRAAATGVVQVQDLKRATLMPPPWVVIPSDIGCSRSFTLLSIPTQQGFRWTPPGGTGLRCVGSNGGWLAGAYIDAFGTVRISLVNPLTNACVEVPAIGRVSFVPHHKYHKRQVELALSALVQKVAFSPNPTEQSFAVAVVGVNRSRLPSRLGIVFARAGCEDWCAYADVDSYYNEASRDVAYHDGKFYYLFCGHVWVVDMAEPSPEPERLVRFKATFPYRVSNRGSYHLAFSGDGALHIVSSRDDAGYGASELHMFVERYGPSPSLQGSSEWTWARRLRGQCLLISDFNQTLCVPADGDGSASLRPDSVYFTGIPLCSYLGKYDVCGGRRDGVWRYDFGTHYIERSSWSRHKDDLLAEEARNRLMSGLDWSKAIWLMPFM